MARPGPTGTLRVTLCHAHPVGWCRGMVVGFNYRDRRNSRSCVDWRRNQYPKRCPHAQSETTPVSRYVTLLSRLGYDGSSVALRPQRRLTCICTTSTRLGPGRTRWESQPALIRSSDLDPVAQPRSWEQGSSSTAQLDRTMESLLVAEVRASIAGSQTLGRNNIIYKSEGFSNFSANFIFWVDRV